MPKNRYIDTRFWDDGFIIDLDPIEKLLFLYFLTNPLTSLCGIYEITIKRIAFDTGIDRDMVVKILARFEKAGKVKWENGWVAIRNFMAHQNYNHNMQLSAEREVEKSPVGLVEWVKGDKSSESFRTIPNGSESFPNAHYIELNNIKLNKEIIDYLNKKTGKNYRAQNKATQKMVNARLKEGYTVEQFKLVIDKKCAEWIGGDMEKYLRPMTLFRPSNFESYVNQTVPEYEKKKKDEASKKEMDKFYDNYKRKEGIQ